MATVVTAVDTFLKSADLAAMRTNIGLAAIANGESFGYADALISRNAAGRLNVPSLNIAGVANTPLLSGTGYSLTGTAAQSAIDIAGTLNTTGNPSIIKVAMSNTASGATTKFLEFLAGASGTTSVFSVDKAGNIELPVNGGVYGSFIYLGGSSGIPASRISANGIIVPATSYLAFSATSAGGTADVIQVRDAANTLALRNSTNAQTLNIYGTYTSGSVYERGVIRWASNVFEIGMEQVGASARAMNLFSKTYGAIPTTTLPSSLTLGSHFSEVSATTDNSYFPGMSAMRSRANAPVNAASYALGGLQVFACTAAGAFTLSGYVRALSTEVHSSSAVGTRLIFGTTPNGSLTVAERLGIEQNGLVTFGGATSSFPALKRSSAVLQARLADDSDFCNIQGKLQTAANAVAETPTATHTLLLRDAAGTTYKVLCVAA
jgi:hypothetical protein